MIKEQTILMTTDEKGLVERRTGRINGELKGIILVGETTCDVEIRIDNTVIQVYKNQGYDGIEKYIALGIPTTSSFKSNYGPTRNDNATCYALNDRLFITIKSRANALFKLTIRWED